MGLNEIHLAASRGELLNSEPVERDAGWGEESEDVSPVANHQDDAMKSESAPAAKTIADDYVTPVAPQMTDIREKTAEAGQAKAKEDEEKNRGRQVSGFGAIGHAIASQIKGEKSATNKMKGQIDAMKSDPSILQRKLDRDLVSGAHRAALDGAHEFSIAAEKFRGTENYAKLAKAKADLGLNWANAMSSPEFQQKFAELSNPATKEGAEFLASYQEVVAKSAALETSWREMSDIAAKHEFDVAPHNDQIMQAANRPALEAIPFEKGVGKESFNNFGEKLDKMSDAAKEMAAKLTEALSRLLGR